MLNRFNKSVRLASMLFAIAGGISLVIAVFLASPFNEAMSSDSTSAFTTPSSVGFPKGAVYDLGTLSPGENRVVDMELANYSQEHMSIEKIIRSCNCLDATYIGPSTLPPGGQAKIRVRLQAEQTPTDWQDRLVVLQLANNERIAGSVRYRVGTFLHTIPNDLNVIFSYSDELETSLWIRAAINQPRRIVRWSTRDGEVQVVRTQQGGGGLQCWVRVRPKTSGIGDDLLTVYTDLIDAGPVVIPVRWRRLTTFSATPLVVKLTKTENTYHGQIQLLPESCNAIAEGHFELEYDSSFYHIDQVLGDTGPILRVRLKASIAQLHDRLLPSVRVAAPGCGVVTIGVILQTEEDSRRR